ncbi:hypothetical protein [Streptomyces sp. NPDC048445]|uniref:LexA family protein n=1 Tax=Streptomyces sp. NPDC048445 TaxID=3365553 RepID=UPI0037220D8D
MADHDEGPSIRQIGERLGLSSSSSVAYQLGRLEHAPRPDDRHRPGGDRAADSCRCAAGGAECCVASEFDFEAAEHVRDEME